MKYTFLLLFLLLSINMFSCSDDDEQKPLELRLVKATIKTSTGDYHPHTVTYNTTGLMTMYRDFPHTYDNQNRLIEVEHFYHESFTYDDLGRIAAAHNRSGPTENKLEYDDAGRMVKVTSSSYDKIYLTYDDRGNVIKEMHYWYQDPTPKWVLEYQYDNMKNPMHRRGSPTTKAYICPTLFLIDDAVHRSNYRFRDYNFTSYYSPNNLVEVKFKGATYKLDYKYNEQGYPVEVTYKDRRHVLEYEWQ